VGAWVREQVDAWARGSVRPSVRPRLGAWARPSSVHAWERERVDAYVYACV